MKIRKIGHCCLIIETKGKKIMTDPGSFTVEGQGKENNIDLILITHEHGDHFHIESIKKILEKNPNAKIITNSGVGKLLDSEGIKYEVLKNKIATEVFGVEFEAHDCRHEEIFEDLGQVENTGYFIDKRLFYPGDAFYNPGSPIEILALPVAGPWCRVRNFVRYALEIKPKVCFPVHDGMLAVLKTAYWVPEKVLPEHDIIFKILEGGREEEF